MAIVTTAFYKIVHRIQKGSKPKTGATTTTGAFDSNHKTTTNATSTTTTNKVGRRWGGKASTSTQEAASLKAKESEAGGVFMSTRTVLVHSPARLPPPRHVSKRLDESDASDDDEDDSSRSTASTLPALDLKRASSSDSSASSATTTSHITEVTTPPSPSSWKTTDSIEHLRNMPLIVSDPEQPDHVILDQAAELGKRMARARKLPSSPWYYASNHIMVNQERTKRTIAPLVRLVELDALAREHAYRMAAEERVFHCQPDQLQKNFTRPSRRLGENVACGESIRDIHGHMMLTKADRNNLLDRRYTHMGMATARGSSGQLFLCQIYRG